MTTLKQSFSRIGSKLLRQIIVGRAAYDTVLPDLADAGLAAEDAWWQSFLRGARPDTLRRPAPLRIVDAFCGAGGLGLGVYLAAEAVGQAVEFSAIVDVDEAALSIHQFNLGARRVCGVNAASLVDYHVLGEGRSSSFGYEPEVLDRSLARIDADVFIAGPPCQGHSNLNNHTRRQDPRNELYLTAAALGVGLHAKLIIIENVPTVLNAHSHVVETAVSLLSSAGYGVCHAVLRADELGAAQRRARHFLLALRGLSLSSDHLAVAALGFKSDAKPASWALSDLLDKQNISVMDTPPAVTQVNQARINYLFDNEVHNLPDDQRPICHQGGTTYNAVYGRMHWDKPAQTITTGFGTPGQGRYIHPMRRRLITPREAARIQGFPDWFDFVPPHLNVRRKHLSKWIGDAVHPTLSYTVALIGLLAHAERSELSILDAA